MRNGFIIVALLKHRVHYYYDFTRHTAYTRESETAVFPRLLFVHIKTRKHLWTAPGPVGEEGGKWAPLKHVVG